MNGGDGEVVLHCEPDSDEPVTSKSETPPVPNPLASERVKTNCFPASNGSGEVENEPVCVAASNAEEGIEKL